MHNFSAASVEKLSTCHPDLGRVFNEVVKSFDCVIIEGHRGQEAQHAAFISKKSKLDWPNGKHNKVPSLAVDAAPYPLDWNDLRRFAYFAGYVLGVANQMGIKLRWGGDWDRDHELKDNTFNDLAHFELVEE